MDSNQVSSEEKRKKEVFEAIDKLQSFSLKNKLTYIEKLNVERTKMQDETYEKEYLDLKRKYELLFQECYDQISGLVKGTITPTLSDEEFTKYGIQKSGTMLETGIADYWLKVMKKSHLEVNENDEKILKHLNDVRVTLQEDKISYTLEFHFSTNEYFTNEVLTKTYFYDVKDQLLKKVEKSGVNWKSEDKIPNKIIKTKKIKSKKKWNI
jgi:nucleosome assembly protein 1-like 1